MHPRSFAGGCADFQRTLGLNRREFLRVGGLGALGLGLPALLNASDYGLERTQAKAKSCIFLFLSGGPSQFETFDPKPEAPLEYRSIFETIRTSVPGTFLSGLLPDLATQAHRVALVRSVWHNYGGHFGGHRYALTGHAAPRGGNDQAARPDDKPGFVGMAAKHMPRHGAMPSSIMVPWIATDQGGGASGGMNAGTLGRQYDPVRVEVDQTTLERPGTMPVFRIPEFALPADSSVARLQGRRDLLDVVESQRREMEMAAQRDMNDMYRSAYELLTSQRIKEGFALDSEPDRMRDRYGKNAFGLSCLMARRLVERGARFVQVNFSRYVTQRAYGWDTHDRGRETLRDHLVPKLNAGLATLIADLSERGLLDETLVVAMGEFGRTPRIKTDGGRDHWPQCYSIVLAGGGVHGGLVHGRSDRIGAKPANDPVEAREILVTIMTLLGIPTFQVDQQGRGAPLFPGVEPVRRLYS